MLCIASKQYGLVSFYCVKYFVFLLRDRAHCRVLCDVPPDLLVTWHMALVPYFELYGYLRKGCPIKAKSASENPERKSGYFNIVHENGRLLLQ